MKCMLRQRRIGKGYPISKLLSEIEPEIIDYIDLDIQEAELDGLTEPGLMPVLKARVKRIHIGTHQPGIHSKLRKVFLSAGWTPTIDYQYGLRPHQTDGVSVVSGCEIPGASLTRGFEPGDLQVWDGLQQNPRCMQQTAYGPVYIRDGLLGFANPRHLPALQHPVETATPYVRSCMWPSNVDGCKAWRFQADENALHGNPASTAKRFGHARSQQPETAQFGGQSAVLMPFGGQQRNKRDPETAPFGGQSAVLMPFGGQQRNKRDPTAFNSTGSRMRDEEQRRNADVNVVFGGPGRRRRTQVIIRI